MDRPGRTISSPLMGDIAARSVAMALAEAAADSRAGIRIGKIAGLEDLSLYAAEIAPGGMVAPHYHRCGTELYQIMEGKGIMRTGLFGKDGMVRYREIPVAAGDCFAIPEVMIHSLVNTGGTPLRAIFTCPAAHLGADRHFISP